MLILSFFCADSIRYIATTLSGGSVFFCARFYCLNTQNQRCDLINLKDMLLANIIIINDSNLLVVYANVYWHNNWDNFILTGPFFGNTLAMKTCQ